MTSKHIETIFQEYLSKQKENSALLINGVWGSGKTFFLKTVLTEVSKKSNKELIYVSLNGISSTGEIDRTIFVQITPYLKDQSWLKKVIQPIANIADATSKAFAKTSISELLRGVSIDMFDFPDKILAFDDLERSKLSISEVLGYINKFVEHKGIKTLILADESKIDDRKKYDEIKEKVVGRVLNFKADIPQVLDSLITLYQEDSEFTNFVTLKKDKILDLMKGFKEDNLRVLSFYIDILHRLYPLFKTKSDQIHDEILLFCSIFCITFKSGDPFNVYSNSAPGVVTDPLYFALRVGTRKTEEAKTDADHFFDKFLSNTYRKYFFYRSIYDFIFIGYLNQEKLEIELEARKPVELTPAENAMMLLIENHNYRNLSDEEFIEQTSILLDCANKGQYSFYDYVLLSNWLFFFCENGLLNYSETEIETILNEGILLAKSNSQIDRKRIGNLRRFAKEGRRSELMQQKVDEIHAEIESNKNHDLGQRIIEDLKKDDPKEIKMIFETYHIQFRFFEYINPTILSEVLLSLSNESVDTFTAELGGRYQSINVGDFLYEEKQTLMNLAIILTTFLDSEELPNLRKFLLMELTAKLSECAEKLENTRKQGTIYVNNQ